MTFVTVALPLAAFVCFIFRRLLRYLHMFQQNEYSSAAFFRWILKTGSFDKRLSAALALAFALSLVWADKIALAYLISGLFIAFRLRDEDPRKVAKKKLVMTQRATRIFIIALILCIGAGFAVSLAQNAALWIVAVHFAPVSLALANLILAPVEAHIQKRIMNEASEILATVNPKLIGITGSFGKTSVKHILGHVLSMNAPTLFTPGSINTLMGVSRVIRENLTADIHYFIVEMGAYNRGSIEKLCRLTPPQFGVITALGEAHYERFGSLDNVARGKFELADAVLANGDGKVVVHENVLAQPYAKAFVEENRDRFVVCGKSEDSDLKIGNVSQAATGLTVTVTWNGKTFDLFAPLYGLVHADNIALVFAAAVTLGMEPDRACAALRTVPQIKHRLEVLPQGNGTTYINDAYNSNPKGFAAALDFLSFMGTEKKGRRILVTPGILELGDKNDEIHRRLGEKAAETADILLLVRPDRIPTLAEGFKARATEKELRLVESFAEAREWLATNVRPSDVILLENDLPDVDESKLVI
ncbi:MAG: UDP-N-acetylmuramoyl-tripeptide--D-alanyl-D-alanine ligase [Alphaproteobacteria bacterium]|nr:UDP-N-acetylmuramoyl-tripeptide--D-alanyl-D-alanine ligase [Alphaproteobacteria bacterium]